MSGIQLINAARSGNAKWVKSILTQNVDVDSSLETVTALMYAANYGNLEVVNILLDAGANINRQDNNGATALIWAAKGDNPDVIQLLFKAGSNIDLQNV